MLLLFRLVRFTAAYDLYIFRVFGSYALAECIARFFSLQFCSFLFFLENTWIRLSRLLFSSLIWWFLWPSLAVIVICCCLRHVVVGISLLNTNCTIEPKLHYLFRFPMKRQDVKNEVNEVNSTSFLASATFVSLYYSIEFSNDTCAWLTSSRANELYRIREDQTGQSTSGKCVSIGCLFSSVDSSAAATHCFPMSIGICRAKWNCTQWKLWDRCVCVLDDDFNFSVKLFQFFFLFFFLSHLNETNSAPTMEIPNEDDNVECIISFTNTLPFLIRASTHDMQWQPIFRCVLLTSSA